MIVAAPQGAIDLNIMLKICESVPGWVPGMYLSGSDVQVFLNRLYQTAEMSLRQLLSSRDPTAWVHLAYMEVDRWTYVYRMKEEQTAFREVDVHAEFAPIGRYGWRYVIELTLSRIGNERIALPAPTSSDMDEAFSLLVLMMSCSESSNLIQHFSKQFPNQQLYLDPNLETGLFPSCVNDTLFRQWMMYLRKLPEGNVEKELLPDLTTNWVKKRLDDIFYDVHGFRPSKILATLASLFKAKEISSSIIVHSMDYMVEWIRDLSGEKENEVRQMLRFICLSQAKIVQDRNFLQKSQVQRMVNYAGLILPQNVNMEHLYEQEAASRASVRYARHHLILSLPMIGEWVNVFIDKILQGRRLDIKQGKVAKPLNDVEQHYAKRIFEPIVIEILKKWGLHSIPSIKKTVTQRRDLPCGEIDGLGWDEVTETLFVVECKLTVPMIDFRSLSQQYNDFFETKKYHEKFLKKILWVTENIDEVKMIFSRHFGCEKNINVKSIRALMVTRTPAISRFIAKEYNTCTYWELSETGPFANYNDS